MRPTRQTNAQADMQFRVLQLLQQHPQLKQRELAERLGISLGKANYCLRALVDKGQVKLGNFVRSDNRMGYVYGLTPAGLAHKAAMTHQFLQRKRAEYEALKTEIETLQAELQRLPAHCRTQPTSTADDAPQRQIDVPLDAQGGSCMKAQ